MVPGDLHFTLGKCSFIISSTAPKKGGKKEHHVGCFSPSFLDYSGGPHIITANVCLVLSGPAWVLGLIDGLMPLLLVFCCRRLLGSVAVDYWVLFTLGPQSKVCYLGAWVGVAKNGPLQYGNFKTMPL